MPKQDKPKKVTYKQSVIIDGVEHVTQTIDFSASIHQAIHDEVIEAPVTDEDIVYWVMHFDEE